MKESAAHGFFVVNVNQIQNGSLFPIAFHTGACLQLHEKLAIEHVAKLERQDIVSRVYRVFGEVLETGQVSLEDVAAHLDIKARTLRTRLAEAGTNFNQLLADYRCNLAKRLLASTDESIDEIVYLTGFSEPSTFYRAFKRWTDQTPIEYRNQKRQQG